MRIVYSRTTDKYVTLQDRVRMANDARADGFVSIHVNSFTTSTARGLETFSFPNSVGGEKLARDIHTEILKDKSLYGVDRGLKTANFYVLKNTNMPATLTELAFISNVDDATILRTKVKEFARQIVAGIRKNLKPDSVVFLDPGHGGNDPGAMGNGLKEKDVTLAVALEVGKLLTQAESTQVEEGAKDFTPSSWAKEAWEWVTSKGLTDGTRPKDGVTREELATILYRYNSWKF